MTAYMQYVEDERGDVVDWRFWCLLCRPAEILPWPCFDWPDYSVHCCECDALIHV